MTYILVFLMMILCLRYGTSLGESTIRDISSFSVSSMVHKLNDLREMYRIFGIGLIIFVIIWGGSSIYGRAKYNPMIKFYVAGGVIVTIAFLLRRI